MNKYVAIIIAVIVLVFLTLIIKGGGKMQSDRNTMRTECNATNYYTVGDKGHLNRIYECPSGTFNQ